MLVIWNGNAGSASSAQEIRHDLENRSDVTMVDSESQQDSLNAVKKAAEEDIERILVAGGDGTINSVVQASIENHFRGEIGILPMGTANDFCASLGLPPTLEGAWEVVQHWKTCAIDMGVAICGGTAQYFANVATAGNTVRVTQGVTADIKKAWGSLAYTRVATEILADLESYRIQISIDNAPRRQMDVAFINVANGHATGGGFQLSDRTRIDDGKLDVFLVRTSTATEIADALLNLASGNIANSDHVEHHRVTNLTIKSEPPLKFSLDGELEEEPSTQFHILPSALKMVVGSDFNG